MSDISRVLVSRLFTRIGDQAWDFVVPLALVTTGADGLRVAALYSFGRYAGQMLLMPRLGRLIDRWPRRRTAKAGTLLQAVGVTVAAALLGLPAFEHTGALWLVALIAGGITASLGATLMEVAVASDLIVVLAAEGELTAVNSRLKQIDLGTEVTVPIVAGLVLVLGTPALPALGFLLVALANILSFYPEYRLLASVLDRRPELDAQPSPTVLLGRRSLRERLLEGWQAFLAQPARISMLAYACLWFTVLSPHGTLLTGFLKGAWKFSETELGLFRGLGAVVGLVATAVMPRLVRRAGLLGASRVMILFQAATLAAGLAAFVTVRPYPFLGAVLLSRLGLYGFTLGEAEIRQRTIPAGQRGLVNGTFAAITSLVGLAIAGVSTVFATPERFGALVLGSTAAVAFGAALFTVWSLERARNLLE